jgi:hypothetical protein
MKNHAVVMARFAFECLNQTSVLTTQLVPTLGIETADLRLRIGLNSGPTTAGGKSFPLNIYVDHEFLLIVSAYIYYYSVKR